MRKVKNIRGQSGEWMCWEETLLCHYAAWQLLFASDEACVVSQKRISPREEEGWLKTLRRILHTKYLIYCTPGDF